MRTASPGRGLRPQPEWTAFESSAVCQPTNKFDNHMLKGLGLNSVQSTIHFATEPKAMQIAVVGNLSPKSIDLKVSDLKVSDPRFDP
jgi:hypothetical protein